MWVGVGVIVGGCRCRCEMWVGVGVHVGGYGFG